ncbi:hypothetical protein HT886_003863 [Salmonella enterica]|nr:hypothetical protein [Salmonella enterica]EDP9434469.1 hypothetical protein [Salmonella enterica subsp. diarizonae]EDR1382362.1 hypothetical protein [Salmonella enterica subsp. diarizonae serovar 61:r:z53]EDT8257214.1 hypothetical protein [Salmonella enterica subsp. diarizonae serovar 48:z52:z]EAP9952712.1 hypothetical protein [Salmonella enterica]
MDNEDKKEWLAEIGETIFGDHWKPALAKHLGTDDSLVRKCASGTRTIPDNLIRGLLSLAHDRANMISRHADRFARELRHEPSYERIIYMPGINVLVPHLTWGSPSSYRKLFSYCGFVPRLRGDKPAIWPPHTKFPILWGKIKQALFGALVCLWRGTIETGVIRGQHLNRRTHSIISSS